LSNPSSQSNETLSQIGGHNFKGKIMLKLWKGKIQCAQCENDKSFQRWYYCKNCDLPVCSSCYKKLSSAPSTQLESRLICTALPNTHGIQMNRKAPLFTLQGVSLESYLKRHKTIILFFYPSGSHPACARQRALYSKHSKLIAGSNCVIIGICSEEIVCIEDFRDNLGLEYRLLYDKEEKVKKMYGIQKGYSNISKRVTFVISEQGYVIYKYESLYDIEEHVVGSLTVIAKFLTPQGSNHN